MERATQLDARHARHRHIRHDHVEPGGRDAGQAGLRGVDHLDIQAATPQPFAHQRTSVVVVVDEQDALSHGIG